ncbi:MAG: hypothetical protein Kow0089_03090 [Desulfobulbaceae bacterium]
MQKMKKKCILRSKFWIDDGEGNVVFGEGRYRILAAVDRLGSLQAAAAELKMSYRALWGRIRASEERLGRPLVEREGRGSRLTPFARGLMAGFSTLRDRIREQSDDLFDQTLSDHLDG